MSSRTPPLPTKGEQLRELLSAVDVSNVDRQYPLAAPADLLRWRRERWSRVYVPATPSPSGVWPGHAAKGFQPASADWQKGGSQGRFGVSGE